MKFYDWARFRDMSSRQKSEINTASTFSEQRAEEKQRPKKDFGIKQMEQEVAIDWGKTMKPVAVDSPYKEASRKLSRLAAADMKAEELAQDNQELEEADSATKHQ